SNNHSNQPGSNDHSNQSNKLKFEQFYRLIPVFVKGGVVIPRQQPNMTTTVSRNNPFELLITVGSSKSTGMLYWDDGESIVEDFTSYNYFYWLFEFVLSADRATLYITPNHTA
ncbi:unnamed protein product, partial [Brugia timori]|uniref:Hint domain-containing protein n=1 Tax=Brugia timori TaxID=42155 RepID=A0A0R3QI62_9BILA